VIHFMLNFLKKSTNFYQENQGERTMFENVDPRDLEEGRKYLMSGSVGGGLPVLIESGKGAVVRDIDGKEYIDCTS
jgi:4-aminobutyrate aminotransferase-like enzyme